jgi:diguanylate cyclase (GGDEF)-like protein
MVDNEIAALALAITDPLTGLSNRRGFDTLAPRIYAVAERFSLPIAAVYIDLDNLKPLNDFCGHDAGDRALIETAHLLQRVLRDSDVVARIGGDEFIALLTNADDAAAATAIERLKAAIAERNDLTDEPFELQFSIGAVSGKPGTPGVSLEGLVDEADARMIAAKRLRKDTELAA